MGYRKCPVCELNFISDDMEMCDVCAGKYSAKKTAKAGRQKKTEGPIILDFPPLLCGSVYGSNAKNIYIKMCEKFGFRPSKAYLFGGQNRPHFAAGVDEDKSTDVWFMTSFVPIHSSVSPQQNLYDLKDKLFPYIKDDAQYISGGYCNAMFCNGEYILEIADNLYPAVPGHGELVFLKREGYIFLGVYHTIAEDIGLRLHIRDTERYPQNK